MAELPRCGFGFISLNDKQDYFGLRTNYDCSKPIWLKAIPEAAAAIAPDSISFRSDQ
jgi:hypothetical protein